MKKLKLLWFVLPIIAWIGMKYVYHMTGINIDAQSEDGVWWMFSSIGGSFVIIGLFVLAINENLY